MDIHKLREVYYWQYSYTGCFTNKLFDLISKADSENYIRLKIAFPDEVKAYEFWQSVDTETFLEHVGYKNV